MSSSKWLRRQIHTSVPFGGAERLLMVAGLASHFARWNAREKLRGREPTAAEIAARQAEVIALLAGPAASVVMV